MITYADKERVKYWPVPAELMAQYKDGSHTYKNRYGLCWANQNGKTHRDGDKPTMIGADGTSTWYQNSKTHRDGDKPAIIWADGKLEWWQNGLCHRCCGPARINPDDTLSWWINGKEITQEVNEWLDGEEWHGTPLQIFEFRLRFT